MNPLNGVRNSRGRTATCNRAFVGLVIALLTVAIVLILVELSHAADVTFEFTPNATGATPAGYNLYQSQVQGSYTFGGGNEVAAVDHPTSTITITGVPDGTYFWVLTAYNTDGESGPSNEVTADLGGITPTPIPGAPSVSIKIIVN